jgi:hypothetical protein
MYLWLENTALHGAGRCFEGRAESEGDVRDLLQFAIELVYSETLYMNGFACETVAVRTEEVLGMLKNHGFRTDFVVFTPPDETRFKEACKAAAVKAASDLDFNFRLRSKRILGIAPDMRKRQEDRYTKGVHNLITKEWSIENRSKWAGTALDDRAGRAIEYMLAICPDLWIKTRCLVENQRAWGMAQSAQLIGLLRYYLNVCLAKKDVAGREAVYAPGVGRSGLVRAVSAEFEKRRLLDEFRQGLDEVVKKHNPLGDLRLPSLQTALVDRAKGDPYGVISEAILLREKAKGLQSWLRHIMEDHDGSTSAGRQKGSKAIREVLKTLEFSLGIQDSKGKKVIEVLLKAIEVVFNLGPLSAKLENVRQIREWIQYWKRRGDIVALTEMSLQAAYPGDPLGWERLLKNCSSRRKM